MAICRGISAVNDPPGGSAGRYPNTQPPTGKRAPALSCRWRQDRASHAAFAASNVAENLASPCLEAAMIVIDRGMARFGRPVGNSINSRKSSCCVP